MGVKRFTDRWKCLYFPLFAKNGGKSFFYVFILKKKLQLLWFLYCMMVVEPGIYC